MGVGELRVDLERRRGRRGGGRRILVRQRAGEAGVRRRPLRLGLDGVLQRAKRLGLVVLLEEQQAPGRIDRGVGGGAVGGAIERVGIARPAERLRGARRTEQRFAVRPVRSAVEHLAEQPGGGLRLSELLMQQAELERGFAARVALARPARASTCASVVPPAHDGELSEHRRRGGITRGTLFRERFGLGRPPARDRAPRHRREALRIRRRVLTGVRAEGTSPRHINREQRRCWGEETPSRQ